MVTSKGTFTATGTSSASRDPKLIDALLELAETRAIARALRWAGIGVECCGFEELGAGEVLGGEVPQRPESHTTNRRHSGNGVRRPGGATSAQVRAIRSLASRLGEDVDEAVGGIVPGAGLEDLIREVGLPVRLGLEVITKTKTPSVQRIYLGDPVETVDRQIKSASVILEAVERGFHIPSPSWACATCPWAAPCRAW